jgi:hypothetical protein
MPFGILVVYRILAIQVRRGAFVALMSSHVPLRLVPRSAMSFRKL